MYRHCKCQDETQFECKKDMMIEDICDDINCCNCSCDMEECKCGFDEEFSPFPSDYMYGQSYVPIQIMNKTYIPKVGLRMGTIFPELVSPYAPGQSMAEIEYLKRRNIMGEGCNNAQ